VRLRVKVKFIVREIIMSILADTAAPMPAVATAVFAAFSS
jgi:hypothetical protein